MEKITYKKSIGFLKSKAVLAVLGGFILSSCGTTMGGYTETDGVYYDPNKDTIPVGVVMNNGNQIGEYYDYQYNDEQNKYLNSDNRNQNWQDSQSSDWGNFTGTETYYNEAWGYPYGFSSGFGFGMSFGFGSPWGYSGYYNPWGFGYSPFSGYHPYYGYYNPHYGYYNPFYGYNPYGYYSPYGNNYNGYGGYNSYNAPRFNNKRSGSDGSGFRNNTSGVQPNINPNSGFKNDNPRYNQQHQNNTQPRYRTTPQPNRNESVKELDKTQPRYRITPQRDNTTPRQETPRYNQPTRSNSSESGFRSGSSSGGFDSGSSSSGSTRSSGGFRR